MASETVSCPWEVKGRIMRVLTAESEGTHTELVDGIKTYQDDGSWVLILPDASEPNFRIYAEASSQDAANELVHRAVLRISGLK